MAFREKQDRILRYDPDLLVVQECESPDAGGDWSAFSDWLWVGENEHKGLGVFARNGLSLEPADVDGRGGRFSLPVAVEGGPDVLGVWAMNDEENPENRYVGQVYRALQDYHEFVDLRTVVAGDFNWNVVWDESPKSPLCGDFSDVLDILDRRGLRSAYHAVSGSGFGEEDDPTFFMHKKRDRPYHTDYVFAPEELVESAAELWVGEYDEWKESSDHVPILVEV